MTQYTIDNVLHFIGEKIPSRKVSDFCNAVIITELPSFYNSSWDTPGLGNLVADTSTELGLERQKDVDCVEMGILG